MSSDDSEPIDELPEFYEGTNEASSEPVQEKPRENLSRIPPPVGQKVKAGWKREHFRIIRTAIARKGESDVNLQSFIHPGSYPRLGSPGKRTGNMIEISGTEPTVVTDRYGKVALWVVPNFVGEKTLEELNRITNSFISYEMATHEGTKVIKRMGVSTNGKARAGPDTYTTNKGLYGAGTYVKCWHQRGHETKKDFEPSRSLTNNRTTHQLIRRTDFFVDNQNADWKVDHFVSVINPPYRRCLAELREELKAHATIAAIQSNITTDFPGRSVIVNRQSGEHFDQWGIVNGTDVLLASGDFSGGEIVFDDLHVQTAFLPRAAVFFDGTVYRHRILPWTGNQRLSTAYFAHRFVFEQLKINTSLSLVDVDEVSARVEERDHAPSVSRSKRRGNGGGGFNKKGRFE
ncbi:hypothetical protein FRC08_004530 [Ceratobasidium sp. 394]|nr:hypothetical protein FRC08_004530 [Ceratobasidium sp. 394]